MSKSYEEYISGVKIESNKEIKKCKKNKCYEIKQEKLSEIEEYIEYIKNQCEECDDMDVYDYDCELEDECSCGNRIVFTFNSKEIIDKYI